MTFTGPCSFFFSWARTARGATVTRVKASNIRMGQALRGKSTLVSFDNVDVDLGLVGQVDVAIHDRHRSDSEALDIHRRGVLGDADGQLGLSGARGDRDVVST